MFTDEGVTVAVVVLQVFTFLTLALVLGGCNSLVPLSQWLQTRTWQEAFTMQKHNIAANQRVNRLQSTAITQRTDWETHADQLLFLYIILCGL